MRFRGGSFRVRGDVLSRQRCRGVVMGDVGGLGNDTVLQLWAEAREDWNDTVAQVE